MESTFSGAGMTGSDLSGRLLDRVRSKGARVGVIGLGYVGLPLAVEFARESGQTLVGFLRGESFNVYSHSERISKSIGPRQRK